MLLKVCEIIYDKHNSDFDKVLQLVGRKRPYFTRNKDELRVPQEFRNTGIFFETNLSANEIAKLSYDVISLFGYPRSDLVINDY